MNTEVSPASENAAEGIDKAAKPKKEKVPTSYIVVSLPPNRDRLSPQLKALCEVIDENTDIVEDRPVVYRAQLLAKWEEKIGSKSADKVFASYMHQMLSFSFLEKIGGGPAKPKKIVSKEERKQKLIDQLSKLPDEDRKALFAELGLA